MNVASITVPAMIHGFMAGRAGVRSPTISVCKTVGILLSQKRVSYLVKMVASMFIPGRST